MKLKKLVRYICLCIYIVISCLVLDFTMRYAEIGLIEVIIAAIVGVFLMSFSYGVLSYALTKEIVVPNCIFLLTWGALLVLRIKPIAAGIFVVAISLVISLVASFLAMLVYNRLCKKNKSLELEGEKKIKKQYVLLAICFLLLLLHGALKLIGVDGMLGFGFSVVSALIFYPATLILAILFGAYSYAVTKKVLLPNLCVFFGYNLFFDTVVFVALAIDGHPELFIEPFLETLAVSGAFALISLVASLIARWNYKSHLKAKNAEAENSTDNGDLE